MQQRSKLKRKRKKNKEEESHLCILSASPNMAASVKKNKKEKTITPMGYEGTIFSLQVTPSVDSYAHPFLSLTLLAEPWFCLNFPCIPTYSGNQDPTLRSQGKAWVSKSKHDSLTTSWDGLPVKVESGLLAGLWGKHVFAPKKSILNGQSLSSSGRCCVGGSDNWDSYTVTSQR